MNPAEEIIKIVFKAAESMEIPLMLVGAAARDFWLKRFAVHANVRTTNDIDLACWVSSWEDYQKLMAALLQPNRLIQDPAKKHRLWLADKISVDIIPFGGIETPDGEIAWPPNFDTTLNVAGFQAAYKDAFETEICNAGIRVIRPHWLALLKLNAFTDNQGRTKDLKDIYFLADNYFDLIEKEKLLYGEDAPDSDILSIENFDIRVGAAVLIARHCRRSDCRAVDNLQRNLRIFNDEWNLTDIFASENGISHALAKRMMDAFLGN